MQAVRASRKSSVAPRLTPGPAQAPASTPSSSAAKPVSPPSASPSATPSTRAVGGVNPLVEAVTAAVAGSQVYADVAGAAAVGVVNSGVSNSR